jgi:hypothetical protein
MRTMIELVRRHGWDGTLRLVGIAFAGVFFGLAWLARRAFGRGRGGSRREVERLRQAGAI